jgi:hypothetical protein
VNRVVILIGVAALALAGCRKAPAPPAKAETKPPPAKVAANNRGPRPPQADPPPEAGSGAPRDELPPAHSDPRRVLPPQVPGADQQPPPAVPSPPAQPAAPPPAARRLTKDEVEQRLRTALAPVIIEISLTQQTPYRYVGTVKDTGYGNFPISVTVDGSNTIRYDLGIPGAGGSGTITPDGRHTNKTDIAP